MSEGKTTETEGERTIPHKPDESVHQYVRPKEEEGKYEVVDVVQGECPPCSRHGRLLWVHEVDCMTEDVEGAVDPYGLGWLGRYWECPWCHEIVLK
jgi:hypothetical protein